MKPILIFLMSIWFSGTVLAGNSTGKIAAIVVADNSTAVLFTLTSPINDTPRCNEHARFSINLIKPGGMATYMALLEAKQQGYEVKVEGLNTCANEWKSEDTKNRVLY